MPDAPVIHIHHDDLADVDRELCESGYRHFVRLQVNERMPQGYYGIGRVLSIQGGTHPLWVLYANAKACA